jgi:hypothetical protein
VWAKDMCDSHTSTHRDVAAEAVDGSTASLCTEQVVQLSALRRQDVELRAHAMGDRGDIHREVSAKQRGGRAGGGAGHGLALLCG